MNAAATTDTPKVWVACLAAYNNGKLHGKWIDAVDEDEINEGIQEVLKTSPEPGAEEWAFHDYDGFPGGMGEHESVEKVAEIGALIAERGDAARAYIGNVGVEYATAEDFEDSYKGEYESAADFAEESTDELGEIPEDLPGYIKSAIDWEHVARNLSDDYHFVEQGGSVYVFYAH